MLESGSRLVRRSLRASIRRPSLPDRPIALPPASLMAVTMCLVDRTGQDHLDDIDGFLVGDPQAVDELRLDIDALQHLADLRSAAVDHDGIDADLFDQDDVTGEVAGQLVIAHGVAAILDDEGVAGKRAHDTAAPPSACWRCVASVWSTPMPSCRRPCVSSWRPYFRSGWPDRPAPQARRAAPEYRALWPRS